MGETPDGLTVPTRRGRGSSGRQREVSRQLTQLVDVVYALVLVEGATAYSPLFTRPEEFLGTSWVPVVLALAFIYFTTIQSFVDYHVASENQPYRLLNADKRKADLLRFYLDIVIVGSYSFLLLKCHPLLEHPDANLTPVFAALPGIFILYLVWGRVRRATADSGSQSYSECLLICFLAAYTALVFAYTQIAVIDATTNSTFLAIAFMLMGLYRLLNWSQIRS